MKRFLKVLIFMIILALCLNCISNITERKYSSKKYEDFFNQEEAFDVLFFGSSHMINGIFPMELYNDYGIISYNMANHNERIISDYYQLLMSLEFNQPKLIVVDLYMLSRDNTYTSTEQLHNLLDAYPISYIKYQAIKNIVVDKEILEAEIEYLFPFSMYHSRWDELSEDDFDTASLYEKGAESRINVAEAVEIADYDEVEVYEGEDTINIEYLRILIEYCQENGIEILLTYLPSQGTEEDYSFVKYGQIIADEYDINYLNFIETEVINYDIDQYNSNDGYFTGSTHLNPSGARKVTSYMGQYIMDHYDIEDHRGDEEYSFWEEDYDEYIDYKISNLYANRENLNNYLMLLYDEEDIEYEITLSSELEIEEDSVFEQLLENLDNNYVIDDSDFEDNDYTIHVVTYDSRTGELSDDVWF